MKIKNFYLKNIIKNIENYNYDKENFIFLKSKKFSFLEILDTKLDLKNFKIYIICNLLYKKKINKESKLLKNKKKNKKVIKTIRLKRDYEKIKKNLFFN